VRKEDSHENKNPPPLFHARKLPGEVSSVDLRALTHTPDDGTFSRKEELSGIQDR